MDKHRHNTSYITWTLALYFGWLLSFPFYGPVLFAAAPDYSIKGFSLALIFSFSHALSLLLGGILLKNVKLWKKLMFWGLGATIAANKVLLFPFTGSGIWFWSMVLMGASSSMFVLGWSCPYSMGIPVMGRMKQMASIIIGANIIYIFFNFLTGLLPPDLILAATGIPLWCALVVLLRSPSDIAHRQSHKTIPLPAPLAIVFCLFAAGLFLNGGFMYSIMLPSLVTDLPFSRYYRYIPYIAVLLIIRRSRKRLHRYFPVYMGVSLMGMSFVSFALLDRVAAGSVLTGSLIEAAFAFIDLFVWTTLGDMAFIYGAPYLLFGFANATIVSSIIFGDLIGNRLHQIGENYRLVTAVFAAAAIFSTFFVIPWLNEQMNRDLFRALKEKSPEKDDSAGKPLDAVIKRLLSEQSLTPRETEITELILKGLSNRAIARQLIISENTVKTHLKHIYQKVGVTRKRELLSLAAYKESGTMHNKSP